jgi:cell division transport system ATP-binding protein
MEGSIYMISMTNVYKAYENGTKAVKGIDIRIEDGEFAFLVGPSGA